MTSIYQKHLANKSRMDRFLASLHADKQGVKTNEVETTASDRPADINLIKTKALNGDLEGVLKCLDELKIPYQQTKEGSKIIVTFSYEAKEYEYVFFEDTAPQSPPVQPETHHSVTGQPHVVNNSQQNFETTTSSSFSEEDYSWQTWQYKYDNFPEKVIKEYFSDDEISKYFIITGTGYQLNDELLLPSVYRRYIDGSGATLQLGHARMLMDNIKNGREEDNKYFCAAHYSEEWMQSQTDFSQYELAQYFTKIGNEYVVKMPLIIGGEEVYCPSGVEQLKKYIRKVEGDTRRANGDFDNIWEYYTREEVFIDRRSRGNGWIDADQDPELNIRLYHDVWLNGLDYSGYAAARWGVRDMADKDFVKIAYKNAWQMAYNSLDLSKYYSKTEYGYDIYIDKFKEDFINALDESINSLKNEVSTIAENRRTGNVNNIWEYYTQEELGINLDFDETFYGPSYTGFPKNRMPELCEEYLLEHKHDEVTEYVFRRIGVEDEAIYNRLHKAAFETLNVFEYLIFEPEHDGLTESYMLKANKFFFDYLNALDVQINKYKEEKS